MELSFLINAVVRRWWLIALCTVLGAAATSNVTAADTGELYYSRAVLNVSPPSQSRVAVSFSSDPDRYVIGQLSVLNSAELAERIATKLPGDETTESVQSSVKIEHQAGTDIVLVTASGTNPERARRIADAYVSTYMVQLRTQVDESQQPDIDQLHTDLQATQDLITFIDKQIENALAPYVNEAPNPAAGYRPVPTPEQVVPDLVTQKQTLLQEYTRLSDTLKELELDAKLRVTSYIVQQATLPTAPESSATSKYFVVAGGLAGAVIGLLLSVAWVRSSRMVLDRSQVEEILGRPVVGAFPRLRGDARKKAKVLEGVPYPVVPFVDQLCVRAEANAEPDKALRVAVVGTERDVAITTIALAMAGRYGANGSSVVLVDADIRHPEISKLFNAGGGIPTLLANSHAAALGEGSGRRRGRLDDPFTSTPVSEVKVLGLGDKSDQTSLRRQNVPELLAAVSADPNVHVVVIDAGPVLDAASTVQICQMVDAVVLAVPRTHQSVELLDTVARQLGGRHGELLPVVTSPHGRRRRLVRRWLRRHLHRNERGATAEAMRIAGDPIIHQTLELPDEPAERRNGASGRGRTREADLTGRQDETVREDQLVRESETVRHDDAIDDRSAVRRGASYLPDRHDDVDHDDHVDHDELVRDRYDELDRDRNGTADVDVDGEPSRRPVVDSPARATRAIRPPRKRTARGPRDVPPIADPDVDPVPEIGIDVGRERDLDGRGRSTPSGRPARN